MPASTALSAAPAPTSSLSCRLCRCTIAHQWHVRRLMTFWVARVLGTMLTRLLHSVLWTVAARTRPIFSSCKFGRRMSPWLRFTSAQTVRTSGERTKLKLLKWLFVFILHIVTVVVFIIYYRYIELKVLLGASFIVVPRSNERHDFLYSMKIGKLHKGLLWIVIR
jgi:hypothetical protein